jgi:hypothetical protein
LICIQSFTAHYFMLLTIKPSAISHALKYLLVLQHVFTPFQQSVTPECILLQKKCRTP